MSCYYLTNILKVISVLPVVISCSLLLHCNSFENKCNKKRNNLIASCNYLCLLCHSLNMDFNFCVSGFALRNLQNTCVFIASITECKIQLNTAIHFYKAIAC